MLNADELIPTRDSLLGRLKRWDDHASWQDFFNTYWKLIYGVALKAGLTDQEAQEVVQETVITVARRIPEFKYDPQVCAFKTWLLNLTRWRITDQLRKRRHDGLVHRSDGSARTATIDRVPDPAGINIAAAWSEEWDRYLLEAALERVKRRVTPEQYQIFDCAIFKEWPVRKIVRHLGVNAGQVYLTKHRVGALLKKEIKTLEKELV